MVVADGREAFNRMGRIKARTGRMNDLTTAARLIQ